MSAALIESDTRAPGLPKRVDHCAEAVAMIRAEYALFLGRDPGHVDLLLSRAYHEGYMQALRDMSR